MSEANEATPAEPTGGEATTLPMFVQVQKTIKETVKSRMKEPYKRMIDTFADAAIAEQTTTLTAGFNLRVKLDGEFKSIRPDVIQYDLDMKPVGTPAFKKETAERAKKLKEQITALDKALDDATNNGVYDKLKQIISNSSNNQSGSKNQSNQSAAASSAD